MSLFLFNCPFSFLSVGGIKFLEQKSRSHLGLFYSYVTWNCCDHTWNASQISGERRRSSISTQGAHRASDKCLHIIRSWIQDIGHGSVGTTSISELVCIALVKRSLVGQWTLYILIAPKPALWGDYRDRPWNMNTHTLNGNRHLYYGELSIHTNIDHPMLILSYSYRILSIHVVTKHSKWNLMFTVNVDMQIEPPRRVFSRTIRLKCLD